MNFKISSLAIRNPIPIIVLFLLLTILGIRAFQCLPINADPDMRFPMVNITVTQTGASADELENTVTRHVENAVAGMAGVRHITSTISDSYAEVRSRTRLNGREVLRFQVFRSKGSSDTAVEKGVQQALQTLVANYPDIQMTEVHNSVNTTKENYDVAIATLLEGAALTVLVVWLFLRNWRATLVAAIALLLSILPAFWIMKLLGYTLNSISLLAITLVIGILVDDAIVEIENIETHIHQGKRPFQAALDASDAIGWAVLVITASIVAVFLPVSFIDGMTGQYRRQCRTL